MVSVNAAGHMGPPMLIIHCIYPLPTTHIFYAVKIAKIHGSIDLTASRSRKTIQDPTHLLKTVPMKFVEYHERLPAAVYCFATLKKT